MASTSVPLDSDNVMEGPDAFQIFPSHPDVMRTKCTTQSAKPAENLDFKKIMFFHFIGKRLNGMIGLSLNARKFCIIHLL